MILAGKNYFPETAAETAREMEPIVTKTGNSGLDFSLFRKETNISSNETINITFPDLQITPAHIVEDDSLNDSQCFIKMEEIISTLESIGSAGGTRHNFG